MIIEAINKIKRELNTFKGDQCANVMKERCAEVLMDFCQQNEEFAQAVVQTDKTLSDCIGAIVKKYTGKVKTEGISDFEAFRAMVQFYFPTAGIHIEMSVDVEANEPAENFAVTEPKKVISEEEEAESEEEEEPEPVKPQKKSLSFSLDSYL